MTVDDTLLKITQFFIDLLARAIELLYNCAMELLNAIILILSTFIKSIVVLFPANPCSSMIASCSEVASNLTAPDSAIWAFALNAIAWLLPIQFLVTMVSCVMMSVMIYFTIAPLMRWAKLIT